MWYCLFPLSPAEGQTCVISGYIFVTVVLCMYVEGVLYHQALLQNSGACLLIYFVQAVNDATKRIYSRCPGVHLVKFI